MQPVPSTKPDRSIGELLADLSRELIDLVRKEFALAKVELGHKATNVGKHVGFIAAGGALAYSGLLVILAAVVMLLAVIGVPTWLSALIVGAACAVAGGIMVKKGLGRLHSEDLAPRQTIDTLKETTK